MTTNVRARLLEILTHGPNINPEFHDNHHIWRRGRVWWITLTVEEGDRSRRIRQSLHTQDVEEARGRRDALIDAYAERLDCALSLRPRRREDR